MHKKLIVILVLLFSSSIVQAETLFYKKDGALITPEEHKILYNIMLETQFPMSLEYGKYVDDEIKAMNEKIKAKLPNSGIEATFIPTTLYEMFCLNYLRDNFEQLKDATFGLMVGYAVKKNELENITIAQPSEALKVIAFNTTAFRQANFNTHLMQWHLAINNFIVEQCKNNGISFPLSFEQAIRCIKKIDFWHGKILNNLRALPQDRFAIIKNERNILLPQDMERAIAIEYQAYNTQQFVLYRGTTFFDDYRARMRINNRSISFGSTLLGGILFDYTACAYYLMTKKNEKEFGYTLFINKKEYAQGTLANMFFIPPLITLLSLCGLGEFFHARTKVINVNAEHISGFFNARSLNLKTKAPFYQIKTGWFGSAEGIYKQITQYIKDHHLVFRDIQKARL